MNKQPLIGISCDVKPDKGGMVFVYQRYIEAVLEAGGVPVLVPPVTGEALSTVLGHLSGIMITGGGDIAPEQFGTTSLATDDLIDPQRDESDRHLIHLLEKMKKPALGICYGMQRMCVARGGKVYQHLPNDLPDKVNHVAGTHVVQLAVDSRIRELFGRESIETITAHHQGIAEPGRELIAVGKTEDGNVEAIESTDGLWWGVQWHVEMDPASSKIIDAFVSKASMIAER